MPESMQHKLDRVRKPRVQITYDVETEGGVETRNSPSSWACSGTSRATPPSR